VKKQDKEELAEILSEFVTGMVIAAMGFFGGMICGFMLHYAMVLGYLDELGGIGVTIMP